MMPSSWRLEIAKKHSQLTLTLATSVAREHPQSPTERFIFFVLFLFSFGPYIETLTTQCFIYQIEKYKENRTGAKLKTKKLLEKYREISKEVDRIRSQF